MDLKGYIGVRGEEGGFYEVGLDHCQGRFARTDVEDWGKGGFGGGVRVGGVGCWVERRTGGCGFKLFVGCHDCGCMGMLYVGE